MKNLQLQTYNIEALNFYLRCLVQLKDYYTILELPPSASADEIKKAYRRLAHQYHPDKKNNDPYAAALFTDIKEAYEILSNPAKKDYYLQERWYAQCTGKKIKQETITPVTILKQMLELDKYVSKLDIHRMYHEGLFNHINTILSDENISTLNSFNEPLINKEIIISALKISVALPNRFVNLLTDRLKKFTSNDELVNKKIELLIRQHKQINYWEKRKIWVVLFIVLLLCLIIFISGN